MDGYIIELSRERMIRSLSD